MKSNKMEYRTFTIWASFDDGVSCDYFEVVAVSPEAAMRDIEEACGEFILISHDLGV